MRKFMVLKLVRLVLATLALALMLGACGGQSDDHSSDTNAIEVNDSISVNEGEELLLHAEIIGNDQSQYSLVWEQLAGAPATELGSRNNEYRIRVPQATEFSELEFSVSAFIEGKQVDSEKVKVKVYPKSHATRLEAESALLDGVEVSSDGLFSGNGYVTNFDYSGDSLSLSTESSSGYYQIIVAYRAPDDDRSFEIEINGLAITGVFPQSADFARFDVGRYWLDVGEQSLVIGGGSLGYELDYIDLIPAEAPLPPKVIPSLPVDPDASPETLELFDLLASSYGISVLSGQASIDEHDGIQIRTNKSPAILAADLVDYSPSRRHYGADPGSLTEELIAEVKERGQILSLRWHWNAPMHLHNSEEQPWWSGFFTQATEFDLGNALTNIGSPEYLALLRDIDAIAVELKKIQKENIPLLWRPIHEAEGKWYWWGASGPEMFKALWRLIFDRITNHHGIHNLLWVLSSEDAQWYPGDDVVDIVGVDAYPEDISDPLVSRWDAMRSRFDGKKLIALTEFGGVPDIELMHKLGVTWSYFVSWTDEFGVYGPGLLSDQQLNSVYSSPKVITLDELNEG